MIDSALRRFLLLSWHSTLYDSHADEVEGEEDDEGDSVVDIDGVKLKMGSYVDAFEAEIARIRGGEPRAGKASHTMRSAYTFACLHSAESDNGDDSVENDFGRPMHRLASHRHAGPHQGGGVRLVSTSGRDCTDGTAGHDPCCPAV